MERGYTKKKPDVPQLGARPASLSAVTISFSQSFNPMVSLLPMHKSPPVLAGDCQMFPFPLKTSRHLASY
ncbi:hypothetical protein CA13_67810 [Planctomycetes bacterium CA13]|uniref:Uncharacterized protein n=1 Tax=Novipirellula herctigrandis TaxID=2527986 RepID=A0A5C5YNG1_9BACT|nr:hypothetical protein CA13_67810 [Planctomycetes bacterium CA13]